MIGGWQLAATRQPNTYRAIRDTISVLAGHGAQDRWIMTLGFVVLGCCHLVTAAGMTPARPAGRTLLAIGGMGVILVAAFPVPAKGSSTAHTVVASIAFIALCCWSLAAYPADGPLGVLRVPVLLPVTVVLVALLVVFYVELHGGQQIGLTERLLAGAQSLWPAVVTFSLYRARQPS
jgi:hypothetical membrane protein